MNKKIVELPVFGHYRLYIIYNIFYLNYSSLKEGGRIRRQMSKSSLRAPGLPRTSSGISLNSDGAPHARSPTVRMRKTLPANRSALELNSEDFVQEHQRVTLPRVPFSMANMHSPHETSRYVYIFVERNSKPGFLGTHQFDLFCTSTHRLYFHLNFTST